MTILFPIIYSQDWDMVCATFADFVDLSTSPAWFGKTIEEAYADLKNNTNH